MAAGQYILGIDLGTTSVKSCLVDINTRQIVAKQSKDTQAGEGGEQDVSKIICAIQNSVGRIPRELLKNVKKIGICGQMHGVLLWKMGGSWTRVFHSNGERFEVGQGTVSPLYTWQDSRCSTDFLTHLPKPNSHLRLATGYGCATLFWKQKNQPEGLEDFDCAGTIQDFLVSMLCDLSSPIMSIQNAASWGYFDTVTKKWNLDLLENAGFPVQFLPKTVVDPGELAGTTISCWYGIPEGTAVLAALGDMQCSVLSILSAESASTAVLNISTSAQLSLPMPPDFQPSNAQNAIEYFPYFNNQYLAVAASLNGGNVMATFVRMIQSWMHDLGSSIPQAHIWERILNLSEDQATSESQLAINPMLFGERHLESYSGASVANISPNELSLTQVTRAICKGLVSNLHSMIPSDMLRKYGAVQLVGTGSALNRNPVLQHQIAEQYNGIPFRMVQQGDAAFGAAVAALCIEN